MMTLHVLNEGAIDAKLTQKTIITSIIASLKSELTCKLINRIPGSRLFVSNLPGSGLRINVELLGKPRSSTIILKALHGKLDVKIHPPSILYIQIIFCKYMHTMF